MLAHRVAPGRNLFVGGDETPTWKLGDLPLTAAMLRKKRSDLSRLLVYLLQGIDEFAASRPGAAALTAVKTQHAVEQVLEISDKAFVDGIELLHLIEVLEAQNTDVISKRLSAENAAGAAMVVRNGLLSRIVLFLAGAYSVSRAGDLHLGRAFDLLNENPSVREELGRRGSPEFLNKAVVLWTQCKGDHRLPPITHFRDKFTAHLSAPNKPPPTFANVFSFAQDTIAVIDTLARGTGARHEPLLDWQAEAAHTAARFWNVWK